MVKWSREQGMTTRTNLGVLVAGGSIMIAIWRRMEDDRQRGDLDTASHPGTAKHGPHSKMLASRRAKECCLEPTMLFLWSRFWQVHAPLIHDLLHHPGGDLCLSSTHSPRLWEHHLQLSFQMPRMHVGSEHILVVQQRTMTASIHLCGRMPVEM